MFHSLGQAAGDSALLSVEWFANVGQSGNHSRAVAGMWCACRLLEGIAHVNVSSASPLQPQSLSGSKRLNKFARGLAKSIAQLWDIVNSNNATNTSSHECGQEEDDGANFIQHVKGLVSLHETLQITNPLVSSKPRIVSQPMLHKSFSLQLLIVLLFSFLSTTALASLHYITGSTSYASPGNLLLSNFDYVLDSVSCHLSHRWLDVDATKVLVVMIHLVGNDIYHGYEVIVEGIVEVLNEVIKIIEVETVQPIQTDDSMNEPLKKLGQADREKMDEFFLWFEKHNNPICKQDDTDYGPAPWQAWGEEEEKGKDKDEEVLDDQRMTKNKDEPVQAPHQALAKQMVTRSMYILT
ncbi:hypothetical protein L218DRAFT_1006040 [Marasmius fiardii PR-910]|nr:hypothetical protein L218DRAFT_1006040 [Marasmius fiardii PR-910]